MKLKYKFLFPIYLFLIFFIITSVKSEYDIQDALDESRHGSNALKRVISGRGNHFRQLQVHYISTRFSEMLHSVYNLEKMIKFNVDEILDELSLASINLQVVREFIDAVYYINNLYEQKYLRNDALNYNLTLEHNKILLDEMLMAIPTIQENIELIEEIIVPYYYSKYTMDKRLFRIILKCHKEKILDHRQCNEKSTHHRQLFILHRLVIVTMIRGYSMIFDAYKYPENYETLLNIIDKFRISILSTTREARRSMNRASKKIYRCDPPVHVEGITYIRLKKFLSSYLTSTNRMGKSPNRKAICPSFKKFESHDYDNDVENLALGCLGRAHDCKSINVEMICRSDHDDRRYKSLRIPFQYIPKNSWTDECERNKIPTQHITNDASIQNMCSCTCDEYRNLITVRTFSLRRQYTNVSEKRVITGIKFIEKNGEISIDIQDGVLIDQSTIDPNTVRWNTDASYPPLNGPETVVLNYDERTLNIDDITVPPGSVVTGVKFGINHGRLSLMIAGVQVCHNRTGEMLKAWSPMKWYIPIHLGKRSQLTIQNPDLPTNGNNLNLEVSRAGKHYIKFQMTDWKKDLSQTTIPYLDAQQVVTIPPSPIGGVGIFFKNQYQTGGFLAFKLISVNYTILMNQENIRKLIPFVDNKSYSYL